jgi:hypothetical protein
MRSAMLTTCLANVSYYHLYSSSYFDRYYDCFKSISRFRHRTRLLRFDRLRVSRPVQFFQFPNQVMPALPNYIPAAAVNS